MAYNDIGLGPKIPIAKDPNEQEALEFAYKALHGNSNLIPDLAGQAADTLKRTPSVRQRYAHLPIIRDHEVTNDLKRVDAQHMYDYERHVGHLEKRYAEQIRALAKEPLMHDNSQDGTQQLRPPIPGSDSSHNSE